MTFVKNLLKKFPAEAYVILFPSLLFLFTISFCFYLNKDLYNQYFSSEDFFSLILGVQTGFIICFIILFLNLAQVFIMIKGHYQRSDLFCFARSALFIFGTFLIGSLALAVAIKALFYLPDVTLILETSNKLASLDFKIFGTYPWLALHDLIKGHVLEYIIYKSYLYAPLIILFVLSVLAFKNIFLFRKLLLSLYIVIIMGIPFWIIFPAMVPDMMYRVNILKVDLPSDITDMVQRTHFSETSKEVLSLLQNYLSQKGNESILITEFPSMHAAWGVIVATICIELWPPLAFIVIPWLIANLIGTLFTLEHYGVDTIFGVVVGFFTLYIVSRLLRSEKYEFTDKWNLFFALKLLRLDLNKTLHWLKRKFEHIFQLN